MTADWLWPFKNCNALLPLSLFPRIRSNDSLADFAILQLIKIFCQVVCDEQEKVDRKSAVRRYDSL